MDEVKPLDCETEEIEEDLEFIGHDLSGLAFIVAGGVTYFTSDSEGAAPFVEAAVVGGIAAVCTAYAYAGAIAAYELVKGVLWVGDVAAEAVRSRTPELTDAVDALADRYVFKKL